MQYNFNRIFFLFPPHCATCLKSVVNGNFYPFFYMKISLPPGFGQKKWTGHRPIHFIKIHHRTRMACHVTTWACAADNPTY